MSGHNDKREKPPQEVTMAQIAAHWACKRYGRASFPEKADVSVAPLERRDAWSAIGTEVTDSSAFAT